MKKNSELRGASRPADGVAADQGKVVLRCRSCGAALTGALRRLPGRLPEAVSDGGEVVPVGFHGEAPSDAEYWPGVERSALVVNPGDLRELQAVGDRSGCCGPSGSGGPNLACPAGHRVAVEVSDCWTPRMVLFAPSCVCPVASDGELGSARVLKVGGATPVTSLEAFCAWAHTALEAADWHGNDVAALVREWLQRDESQSACIVWFQADESVRAGVPIGAIEEAIAQAQQGAALRRLVLQRAG